MKTLIFNGSPRKEGDTAGLIRLVTQNLLGDYKVVSAYDCDIRPCVDCRFCWSNDGCSIKDGMQEVYGYIKECDNILIASPIYFSELTGALLNVGSRLQTYFCAGFFRKERPVAKEKKGAVILTGGGDGNMDKAYDTACCLLRHMNAHEILSGVFAHNTNEIPAAEDEKALAEVKKISEFFHF